jgi:hypothetical protein
VCEKNLDRAAADAGHGLEIRGIAPDKRQVLTNETMLIRLLAREIPRIAQHFSAGFVEEK